ncbi:hypothetical protein MTO96_032910 [Rhipicephalus appendiculatus]
MRAQADLPASRDDRRAVSGGATTHPGGPRRAQGGLFSSYAWKIACIVLAIMFMRTVVSIARLALPVMYCEVKDSVTKQYMARCCALKDDQLRLLQSVYSNLSSLPTIDDTRCLRYLPRCVLHTNERAECLKMRRRYGSNVFSLLEPRDSFTVYTRKDGPGSILCKNIGFCWIAAIVVPLVHGMVLAMWGFFAFVIVRVLCIWRTPPRPEPNLVGRGGTNDDPSTVLTPGNNARPIIT